jgi:exodeoxyribonuclease-3
MQIATWNVNSVRARLPRLLPWLEEQRPDVVCLQETKVVDELFPAEPFEDLGYSIARHGQKSYNGVAILSRLGLEDVTCGMSDDQEGEQARVLAATVEGVMILNLYVVNGREVGCDKYDYKLQWLERVRRHMEERFPAGEKVVITGDFNITFDDRDVYDPEAWRDRILCSTPEREALQRMIDMGYTDAFRCFHEEGGLYTWWDFRTRGYQRGEGLRIDHFLMSEPALSACTGVEIDLPAREGAKPSDHAPVIATLS